jgi:hypothetical protein
MNKPKYLKLIAVVEEGYKTISGGLSEKAWSKCDNVLSIKLEDDFSLPNPTDLTVEEGLSSLIHLTLEDAKMKSKGDSSNE